MIGSNLCVGKQQLKASSPDTGLFFSLCHPSKELLHSAFHNEGNNWNGPRLTCSEHVNKQEINILAGVEVKINILMGVEVIRGGGGKLLDFSLWVVC